MIKSIKFENFRNLDGKEYSFENNLNILTGKNGDGKTNVLEGVRIAFSSFDGNYIKLEKSDFKDSDDSKSIKLTILLVEDAIPSFHLPSPDGGAACGFKVIISKTSTGRYVKRVYNYNGTDLPIGVVEEDRHIPKVYMMPLMRLEDIYSPGLTTGIENFIKSETEYETFKKAQKDSIKLQISEKVERFKAFSMRFKKILDIDVSDPKMSNEKLYIVDGEKDHNVKIGSGYKSIANIILCSFGDDYNIILIDEIENHLHPALLRNLISEVEKLSNVFVIATTHSPVVINEFSIRDIVDVSIGNLSGLISDENISKLDTFLHPGRAELILADNVVLVEGFTEEVILRHYVKNENLNWTIVNVAGVMFEPYAVLANKLHKKLVVISDNDRTLNDGVSPTSRFVNLKKLCDENSIRLIEIDNTLETEMYNQGLIMGEEFTALIKDHKEYPQVKIAKSKKKTSIALKFIESNIDLSNWRVITGIADEFAGN